MTLLKYLLVGLIQGITETIPVSSSGHLMIIKKIIDLNIDYDTIAILTNFGSLIAIIALFYDDIIDLIGSFFKYIKSKDEKYKSKYNYCWMIVLGCIPAGFTGLAVSLLGILDKIENHIKIVGISLIITSILLFIVKDYKGQKTDKDLSIKDAIIVGLFQIMGIFPGISRSGSTIVGGMFSNLKRDTAFKYSFMLYIPMSIAATGLELLDLKLTKDMIIYSILAIIVSGLVTYFVTKWFRKIVKEGKLIYFSAYCLIVGLLVILFLN